MQHTLQCFLAQRIKQIIQWTQLDGPQLLMMPDLMSIPFRSTKQSILHALKGFGYVNTGDF